VDTRAYLCNLIIDLEREDPREKIRGNPFRAIAMKPLGDAFIKLISMIIMLIIFCTVVTGIAGMQDIKRSAASEGRRCCTLRSSRLRRC